MKVAQELQEKDDNDEAMKLIAAEDAEEEPKGEPVTKYVKADVAK
jgi:hypothetical protein